MESNVTAFHDEKIIIVQIVLQVVVDKSSLMGFLYDVHAI